MERLTQFNLRHCLLACLCLIGSIWVTTAARADAPVFNASAGAAIQGYDVVAYFTSGTAELGDPKHAVMWKGAIWRFASSENREMFEANPRAFAPQYGGYCAYGVSQGYVVRTNPNVWRIHDGKLYLIHSPAIWKRWVEDIPSNIVRADANWPAVLAAN